jgi:hypothetical protein
MAKYKIEIEIDVDFQKFFDDIPEGLFDRSNPDENGSDEYYEKEVIGSILSDSYTAQLEAKARQMNWKEWDYAKHHALISVEVSKQMRIAKITKQ